MHQIAAAYRIVSGASGRLGINCAAKQTQQKTDIASSICGRMQRSARSASAASSGCVRHDKSPASASTSPTVPAGTFFVSRYVVANAIAPDDAAQYVNCVTPYRSVKFRMTRRSSAKKLSLQETL